MGAKPEEECRSGQKYAATLLGKTVGKAQEILDRILLEALR